MGSGEDMIAAPARSSKAFAAHARFMYERLSLPYEPVHRNHCAGMYADSLARLNFGNLHLPADSGWLNYFAGKSGGVPSTECFKNFFLPY